MEHYFTNNENLKSELRHLDYKYQDFSLCFTSDNGVFSKDRIDYGSRFMLETFIEYADHSNSTILDLGCGYGFVGISLAKIINAKVSMCDVNARALHLTKMNIKSNNVSCEAYISDCYNNVNGSFDYILCNPPIKAGKSVIMNMLTNAKDYLNENGELWFVMTKDHGLKSTLKALDSVYDCQVIKKSKTFYVILAKIR